MWTVEEPPMPFYKYEPQPVLQNSSMRGPQQLTELSIATDGTSLRLTQQKKSIRNWLTILNRHNLHSNINEKFQKYTDLKEES
jgi:hypothetical protein